MTEAYPSNNQKLDRQFQKSDWWDMRLRLKEQKFEPSNLQPDATSIAKDAQSISIQPTDLLIQP